jgi:hypothetical protein
MNRMMLRWVLIVIAIGSAVGGGLYWVKHVAGPSITSLPADNFSERAAGAPLAREGLGNYVPKRTGLSQEASAAELAAAKKVIEQLDDTDSAIRSAASLRLNSLDGSCLDLVEASFKDPTVSPEQKVRLEKALRFLRPRTRNQKMQRQMDDWLDVTMHQAYATHERRDAPWNAKAHHAIDLMIQLGVRPMKGSIEMRSEALTALADVILAACDDPFIRCLYGMCQGPEEKENSRSSVALIEDTRRVLSEDYPPYVKLFVSIGYLFAVDRDMMQSSATAIYFRELVKQKDLPPGVLVLIAKRYCDALLHLSEVQYIEAFCRDFEKYAPANEFRVVAATAKNNLGDARANSGKSGLEDFAEASRLAEMVWSSDPSDVYAARLMMTIRRNQAAGDAEIDTWFQRAVDANPDAYDIYLRRLNMLWEDHVGPDSGKGADQMLAFGHECLAMQNWRGGAPLVLVEAHRRLADDSDDRRKYLARPEVWRDIADAYEGGLLNFPNDFKRRSEYAKQAAQCGKWDVVERQFALLGDKADMGVFVSKASYRYLRKKAERLTVPRALQ